MNGTTALPRVVVFNDYSNYDSSRSRNGGNYWFGTKYSQVPGGLYKVTEHTSGEFCPYCRNWNCTGVCHDDEFVTNEELQNAIEAFEQLYGEDNEEFFISIED